MTFPGRYSRQELFRGLGPEGQARLGRARVLVLGCGALGTVASDMLVRAGVGAVRIVDRDFVEPSNLQRQSLFDEDDARRGLPKAVAARDRLARINGEVEIDAVVADFAPDNAERLLAGADLVIDGTDNFEARYLLNDACVRAGRPWAYGACVAAHGLALLVRPGHTPCLRCVMGDRPAAGSGPTCDTAGVIAPVVHVVAGLQVAQALKLLAGREAELLPGLATVEVWDGELSVVDLSGTAPSCPACTRRRFDYLDAAVPDSGAVLCGRDAVQVRPAPGHLDLGALADRLARLGDVQRNEYLVRFRADGADVVVFGDGRAIVQGTHDVARARSLYAKYVGS